MEKVFTNEELITIADWSRAKSRLKPGDMTRDEIVLQFKVLKMISDEEETD